jgi:hypothetical protein
MPFSSQEPNSTRGLAPPLTLSRGNQGSSEFLSTPVKSRPGPSEAEDKPVHPGTRDRSASHGPAVIQTSSQMNGGTQRSTNTVSSKSNALQSPRGSTITGRTTSAQADDGNKVGTGVNGVSVICTVTDEGSCLLVERKKQDQRLLGKVVQLEPG